MKQYTKIVLLVALALILTLTACNRSASTSPVATATTNAAEPPFPVDGTNPQVDVNAIASQTAMAAALPTVTAQVIVATEVPSGQTAATAVPQAGTEVAPSTAATLVAPVPAQPQTVVNTPLPAGPRPTTYALQNGEWPLCIARRYNLDINSFFSTNGLNMNSKPAAGIVLKIPATGTWDTATFGSISLVKHPTPYTVAAGDTIYTIACRFGDVNPDTLLTSNNLAKPTDIKAGQQLSIP